MGLKLVVFSLLSCLAANFSISIDGNRSRKPVLELNDSPIKKKKIQRRQKTKMKKRLMAAGAVVATDSMISSRE